MERSWISSAMRLAPLELCGSKPLTIRMEKATGFGLNRKRRLLYASDLHLGWPWSDPLLADIHAVARETCPDLALLGGDLVDRARGLPVLEELVKKISALCPVWAVGGNHDRLVGVGSVREAVERAGGRWLEGLSVPLSEGAESSVTLEGGISSERRLARRILCAHDPAIYPRASAAGFRLVLAGHLHGGQCVLAMSRGRLYPGIWFNRWTALRFDGGKTVMLVSRGAADTLPIRWNCPREVLLCELS